MEIAAIVVEKVTEKLIDAAKTEVSYLCCLNTHVESFEDKREKLTIIRSEVLKHIEEGKRRNETQVEDAVEHWLKESDVIIQEDKKARKKWFHGCIWQYRQGKELAKKMQSIEDLIERSYYFHKVARQAELPSQRYFSQPRFIDFESRKSRLEELLAALKNGNYNMIGLHGLGGTGKTTMAKQVGISVEQSKAFEKVIFVVVSDAPNINRIQADIAEHLNMYLEEAEEADRSKVLWSRIANVEGRLLIILDDVRSALNLKDIGIPFGNDRKNCCVLVTSSDLGVCREMRCQLEIHLQALTDEDALNLFMTHVNYDYLSSNDLHGIAKAIVKECKGLPTAIASIARSLKKKPVAVWKNALRTMQDSQPGVDENVYSCLRLSYDYLKNEKAKKLLLLCSLLPEDYEIRLSLLISLAIGAGIFGEIYEYWEARSQALEAKNELIVSCLLLEVEKGVKMHELIREVTWRIAKEDTQMIVNSKVTPKSDLRFLVWSGYDFPNQFHCTKLEVLFLWIKGYVKGGDANSNFEEMGNLRVLFLCCDAENHLVLSLHSFLVLKNIRTLILNGWELYDISILKNMQSLETLELNDCRIIELAKEITDLKKLKLLGLRRCSIGMNNPFEVIGRCSQLEELYFVDNGNVGDWKLDSKSEYIDKVSQDITPPALKVYSIACSGLEYFDDDDNDMSKCFNTKDVMNLISGSMFQYLVEKAEVLELGGMEGTRWRSFVPDIIPIKDGAMNDLIKLCLYELSNLGYLIDANKLVYPDVTVFSKLVELHMRDVEVEGLCLGPIPSGFLLQLQVLKLSRCMKLLNIFLDGSLKLPNLKVLKLENCPMFQPSIFEGSVAASLAQLEKLVIEDCAELISLIAYDESLGGKMRDVEVEGLCLCPIPSGFLLQLQVLKLSRCMKLLNIFLDGSLKLPNLKVLKLENCPMFQPSIFKRSVAASLAQLEELVIEDCAELISLIAYDESLGGKMRDVEVEGSCLGPIPFGFLLQLRVLKLSRCTKLLNVFLDGSLKLPNLKFLKLENCPMFQPSIFKRSVAASLAQLEELVIEDCAELISLIADDESSGGKIVVANHQNNSDKLFPRLLTLEINGCDKLKMVSPLLLAGDLPLLRDLCIRFCEELRYVFDEYRHEGQFLHQLTLLPLLTKVDLYWVPSFVNIFQICQNWTQKPPPIVKDDSKEKHANSKARATDTNIAVPKAKMQTISLESGGSMKRTEIVFTADCLLRAPLYFQSMRQMKLWEVSNIKSLFSVSIAETTMLEELEISYCEELKHIITNDDREDYDHKNLRPIFPKLQELHIYYCDHLEFIFPSTLSGGLKKLKNLTITGALRLEYVFRSLSKDNETGEFHIDLPALEALSLEEVPNMVSICFNSHQPKSDAAKANKTHMQHVTSPGAKKYEIEEINIVEGPSSKYGFNFDNLQQISIIRSPRLETLFSTSTWRSLPQLSELHISECDSLRSVVEDDSKDHGHINYSSIFPKLEDLQIWECMKLEFLFPSFLSGGLRKLKHLVVKEAPKLKYIFYDEDCLTKSDEVQVDLSALETLSLANVPDMMNICAQKHTIFKLPSLQKIALDHCQELILSARPSSDSTLYWKPVAAKDLMRVIMHQQKLTSLEIEDCITEEIFNFEEYGEVEGTVTTLNLELMRLTYLSELRRIFRSRKHVLRLHNLCELEIKSCTKLRVVFSASMSKSLPQLSHLRIKKCPELVHIIEDDDEDHFHQHCFPKLEYIGIKDCDRLKFLFPISESRMLPKLRSLQIVRSANLEKVFTYEEDDIQKMELKYAFPTLLTLILRELPSLVTICGGIHFHTLQDFEVVDCPRYQGPQDKAATLELPSAQEMAYMGPNFAKKVVLKLDLDDDRAKNKAMKMVYGIQGVESISVDIKEKKLTLIGDIDPVNVVSKLREVWHTEIVSVGPAKEPETTAKEPEKTKDESKKDDKELEDEQTMSEPTVQLQHQDRGNVLKRREHSVVESIEEDKEAEKFSERLFESIEGDRETEKEVGKVVVPALELKKVSSMKDTDEQGFEEHDGLKEAILTRKQSDVSLDNSQGNEFALNIETEKNNVVGMEASAAAAALNAKLASVNETLEQGLQEHDTSKNVQSADSESRKQSTAPLDMTEIGQRNKETMKQGLQENYAPEETTRIIQSANSSDLTKQSIEPSLKLFEKDFAEIVRRIVKETMKQNLQENYAPEEAVRVFQSPSSDVTKQSTEPFLKLSQNVAQSTKEVSKNVEEVTATEMPPISTPFGMEFKKSLTIKETRGASIEDRPMSSVKPTRVNISNDVISSLRQSQIGSASPSSSSIFETGEILELVELKDDERILLVETLELHPKLRLSRRQRPIIAFAYRVLVDILIMLNTKNPYTMTEANKSTLEANLGAAKYFEFDNDWVESVRTKIFDMDMGDILATREKILLMEAELEVHDSALGQMKKERAETKERLAMARRKLEMAQSEFEVIDSQMLGLLVDYKLITKMVESGEASAKDGTFGI